MKNIRLVYFSKASGWLDDADLQAILDTSRQNNEQAGIKGLLLHVNGVFVQVLEGPEQIVRSLVDVIKTDPRHVDLRVVHEVEISAPLFDDWTMAYLNDDLAELLKAAGIASSESAVALFATAENERIATGSTSSALNLAVTRAIGTYVKRLRKRTQRPSALEVHQAL